MRVPASWRRVTGQAASVCALLLGSAGAQLKILAPDSLANEFPETHGIVYGTTATFGAPQYGERVIGRLIYGESKGRRHCTAEDYELAMPARAADTERSREAPELINVVLVRRGGCSFVTKVQVAQDKNAHAVIVVDKETSNLNSEEIQKIIMADDGYGSRVRIPSLLISRFEGEKLIDAVKAGNVVVELAWDMPRGQVVIADFWMSSGSRESSEFLERFKDSAETLKYHLQFVPRYHIFSLLGDKNSSSSFNHLCARALDSCSSCSLEPHRYCAPDPDGTDPVTGADVTNEDLRQLCVWNTTARRPSPEGAWYSQEFWDYSVCFLEECSLRSSASEKKFGYECSKGCMATVGVEAAAVDACVKANYLEFLDKQLDSVAWSDQALRLNGWRYSGPLDPETVLKAVCSGYTHTPRECKDLLSRVAYAPGPSLSFVSLLFLIAFMVTALVLSFAWYRRHVTSTARKVIREEVMLEVQSQMADYVPFEDAGGGSMGQSKPLSF